MKKTCGTCKHWVTEEHDIIDAHGHPNKWLLPDSESERCKLCGANGAMAINRVLWEGLG